MKLNIFSYTKHQCLKDKDYRLRTKKNKKQKNVMNKTVLQFKQIYSCLHQQSCERV